MEGYTIRDYRKSRPIRVRAHTRGGESGFLVSFKLFVRKASIVSLIAVIVGSSYVSTFFAGGLFAGPAKAEADTIFPTAQGVPPVMQRIARCESRSNQYCSDDAIAHRLCKAAQKGQVLQRANTNGTIDTGKYQLNSSYWGAELSAQGFDITKEKDNEAAALYIYANHGTGPWSSSSSCWR